MDPILLFMFHVCFHNAVITYWERADHLTLVCAMLSCVLSLSNMVSPVQCVT